ncbi:MAG: hypothetical protein PVJ80_14470 [Gemmatimonadota bacterium]|jgi:hypothetical protein
MRPSLRVLTFVAAAATTAPSAPASAPAPEPMHFKLLEPISWIVEDDRGDPQKAGPCGGSNTDWGEPTYAVNEATGGQSLHIAVLETIYHPGHYRIALAVNSPNELPPDPEAVTRQGERGPISVSGAIQDPPVPPVLVDGLWYHDTRPSEMQTYETDVRLPNIDCEHCTLQIIQFMNEHGVNNPGMFTYHHCATMRITADPSLPIDTRWPADRAE